MLIDLGSKTGTLLNEKQLEANVPHPLGNKGDVVTFG